MTPHLRYGLIGVAIGLILFIINPWLAIAVIAARDRHPGDRLPDAVAGAASSPPARIADRKQLGG